MQHEALKSFLDVFSSVSLRHTVLRGGPPKTRRFMINRQYNTTTCDLNFKVCQSIKHAWYRLMRLIRCDYFTMNQMNSLCDLFQYFDLTHIKFHQLFFRQNDSACTPTLGWNKDKSSIYPLHRPTVRLNSTRFIEQKPHFSLKKVSSNFFLKKIFHNFNFVKFRIIFLCFFFE